MKRRHRMTDDQVVNGEMGDQTKSIRKQKTDGRRAEDRTWSNSFLSHEFDC